MAHRVTSEVDRIYPSEDGKVFIRLKNPRYKPKDRYFFIGSTHPNFNSLYSLALVAAVNRQKLQIRTKGEIYSTSHAEVQYMVLDW